MPPGARPRLGNLLLIGVAVLAFGWCSRPLLHVGLLADDYFAGQGVAGHVAEHPNVVERIATTFTRRWSEALGFWHRPMLVLGVQADYAMFGPDGRRHHLTSMLLWCLVAAAAAAFSRQALGSSGPATPAVVFAIALFYPAGIEALAWLVARDDILLALFSLLALRAKLARPRSVFAPLPWLVLALFSKETAAVLPPLLTLAGLLAPASGTHGTAGRKSVWIREAAPWVVLGAWFAFRHWVIGGLRTSYGPTSYFGDFDLAVFLGNFGRSFLQLLAPANATAFASMGLPLAPVRAAFLLSTAAILAGGVFARLPGDGRRALLLLAGVAAPLCLLSPVFFVNDELNGGRGLVLPAALWIVLLGLAFDRARRRPRLRAVAIAAVVVLALASAVSFVVALVPYVQATGAAEALVKSLDPVPPGEDVWVLKTYEPVNGMRPDVIRQAGAYVLSVGLHPAMGPPFRQAPPVGVTIVKSDAELLAAGAPRPWVALLPPDSFEFRILARGGSHGAQPEVAPRHGSALDPAKPIVFAVRVPPAAKARLATISIVAVDLEGREFRADVPVSELAAGGTLEVPAARLFRGLDLETLRGAGTRVFLWWAEGRSADGSLLFRAPWQAVAVSPGA